jgi:hypothetical protein
MERTKSTTRLSTALLSLFVIVLASSCTIYQNVPDDDGIYSSETRERTERQPRTIIQDDSEEFQEYEKNYFTKELERIDLINGTDILTDIESYSSFNDTIPNEADTDRVPTGQAWGFNDSDDVVINVNLNNAGWGWGWGGWGWGGFYDPWFDPFPRFGWGWGAGWGGWGWGAGWGPGWGWGRPGWGFAWNGGWGWNRGWGWNSPYWRGGFGVYGRRYWNGNVYGRRGLAFNNGFNRRGSFLNRNSSSFSRRSATTSRRGNSSTTTRRRSSNVYRDSDGNVSRRTRGNTSTRRGRGNTSTSRSRGNSSRNRRSINNSRSRSNNRSYNRSSSRSRPSMNRSRGSSRSSGRSGGSRRRG